MKYITGPGQATTQVVRNARVCIVDAYTGKFIRFLNPEASNAS